MNLRTFKPLSYWAACLLLLGFAGKASASDCWDAQAAPQIANFGTVQTSTSLSIGARIAAVASSPSMLGNTNGTIIVTGNARFCERPQFGSIGLFTSAYDASQKIYNTNIPGVGIRIFHTASRNLIDPDLAAGFPFSGSMWSNAIGESGVMNPELYLVELIKTADTIGSGTLTPGIAATRTDISGTVLSRLQITGTISNPVATCHLSTASATFDMGTHPASAFNGSQHPVGWATQNQSLISGGCTGAKTVSMTFSGFADTDAPDAFENHLGTAKGVAIELWRANSSQQAMPNDPSKPVTFTPVGAGGKYEFSARYRQTKNPVTAGSVNAHVIVNVNYN